MSCAFINNTFRDCAYECGDCGGWYTGSGHSFTDVNNSLVGNQFVRVRSGVWARIGLQPPSSDQVHAVYLDDMMSGYTISRNRFVNCSNAVQLSGRNITVNENTCTGCFALVSVGDVGDSEPQECANELQTLRSLIEEAPAWNRAFPALQSILEEGACGPVDVSVSGNQCAQSGAALVVGAVLNASWRWSVDNNSCGSQPAHLGTG